MGRVVAITSGKGGVGKTTSAAALATGLAQSGARTIAIDLDIGLRNLDLAMGFEGRIVHDLLGVVNDKVPLASAVLCDPDNQDLHCLAAPQTQSKDKLTRQTMIELIDMLREEYDWVVIDTPAGIEPSTTHALEQSDDAIVVLNPELASIRDADRVLGLIGELADDQERHGRHPTQEHLLLTRYAPRLVWAQEQIGYRDVSEHLHIPVLGVIPESPNILRATNRGHSVIQTDNRASTAYQNTVARLQGQQRPLVVPERTKPNLIQRLAARYDP